MGNSLPNPKRTVVPLLKLGLPQRAKQPPHVQRTEKRHEPVKGRNHHQRVKQKELPLPLPVPRPHQQP